MTMNATHHGGRIGDARAQFGGDIADWLDLSTGINPRSWTPPADMQIDWQALPDPRSLAMLEAAAAAYFGVDPTHCLAVPGSESALRAIAQLLALPGCHRPLSYSTHADAFARTPISPIEPSVLVLGNPNNPDGHTASREAVLAALAEQETQAGWLLVDEAFVDCMPHLSVAAHVTDDRRLIVTRSFGKFFGLAGVRLGFVIAPASLLARLRHLQGEWPVCAAAIAFGIAAYADATWIETTRRQLAKAASDLDAVLLKHGLTPYGDCPLFRLVETERSQHLFQALARKHILTRAFADHPRLLRSGLPGNADTLARLDWALADG